jgi:phosphate starvation-inducible PhoH-like protein
MNDEHVTQRLNAEGADMLTLAGVNDSNLVALSRITGVRVSLRGDSLTLAGPGDAVERATPVAQRMLDTARQQLTLTPDDVQRLSEDPGDSNGSGGMPGEIRLALPGVRRIIQPKTAGQAEYMKLIAENDIVVGIGPARTGKTYLAVAMAVDALARKRVRRIVLARPAVEAGESLGFLPGDMQAKVDPYLRPLYDALDDMMPAERVQ